MALQGITIDRASDAPIFVQLCDALRASMSAGDLAVGGRLPSVRTLAEELGVNSMTVARAYRELAGEGLLTGRGALGTFVTAPGEETAVKAAPSAIVRDFEPRIGPATTALAEELVHDDTFRRMLDLTTLPGVIPMTQAYPDAHAIDIGAFRKAVESVLKEAPDHLYSYCAPDGLPSLKTELGALLSAQQITLRSPNDLIVTTGGQQALNIVVRALVGTGDVVLVERPSFFGALDLFRSIGARMVGVDLEDDGPDIEQMERELRLHRPKLMFLMPTFHNPTGITTSLEKRRRILELSRQYQVPILEDDHCPEVRFSGSPIPPIKAMAEPDEPVFYARGMGKAFVPGVRLGFVAAPAMFADAVVSQKAIADLHTSPLLQEAFSLYLRQPSAAANLEALRARYAGIQATVCAVLEEKLPEQCRVTRPDGGFNLWLRLAEGVDSVDLCWAAAQRGVGVLMGTPLFADQADRATIRLSYGLADEDLLRQGVERLCVAIADMAVRRPRPARMVI